MPVLLPDTRDPPFTFLQVITWIDFSQVATVSDAPLELERLLTAVRGGTTSGELRDAICPYRGLDAFREEDAAFFFGRGSGDDPKSAIGELVLQGPRTFICDGGRPLGERQVFAHLCRLAAGAATRAQLVLECPDADARLRSLASDR